MREPRISTDIYAVAEFMRKRALQGCPLPPDACSFVVGALDALVVEARALEEDFAREENWRRAADARIEALTTPDYVAKTLSEIAIEDGRRAGVVIDLRPFLDHECDERASGRASAPMFRTRTPINEPERAPDTVAAVASDGGNGDAA